MYAPYFGLTQDPFSIAPDPHYLFMSERHREALAHLLYGLDGGGGFVLLTGEIGTGKTTVCRCFLEQMPAHCTVAYIVNPLLSAHELLQSVCEEFGMAPGLAGAGGTSTKPWVDWLNRFLLQAHAQGRNCVLIIDEAQLLSAEVLEQLRLLTNLETRERKLLQIILIGQPELRTMLARPALEQLAQRVIARYHLDALTAQETAQYITHRLAVAGRTGPPPFDRAALQQVHQLARGVPRRINLLCGRALLGAYANGQNTVNRATVVQAAREVFGTTPTAAATGRGTRVAGWTVGLGLLAGAVIWGALATLPPDRWPWAAKQAQATEPAESPEEAPAPAVEPAAAPRPVLDAAGLAALLPSLPQTEPAAWQALAPRWGIASAAAEPRQNADPCGAWQAQNLQCFKASRMGMAQIRLLDRPGILTLAGPNGRPAYAVLAGVEGDTAVLDIEGVPHAVPLATLAGVWRGEFATLWRSAPGYPGHLGARAAGSVGPVMDWLGAQLGALPGMAEATGMPLAARISRFQLAQGLTPDGQAGPMTFMQLNRALGIEEPRLQTSLAAER